MKAKLLPLKGKYYGSEIEITTEFPSWPLTHIKIWCDAEYLVDCIEKFEYRKRDEE